jgi:CRISPR-associated protein Csh1
MFVAIKEIGEYAIKTSPSQFRMRRSAFPKNKTTLQVIIFDPDTKTLDCDPYDIVTNPSVREKYLWIGNAESNSPQLRLTTDRLEYLIGEMPPHKQHKQALLELAKMQTKCPSLLKNPQIKELHQLISRVTDTFFQGNYYQPLFNQIQAKVHNVNSVALWTVAVKTKTGKIELATHPGYRCLLHALEYGGIIWGEGGEKHIRAHCQLCKANTEVLVNPRYPAGSFLKVFNVDKKGFMPALDGSEIGERKSHLICGDCKYKLLKGLEYIEQHLRLRIGDIDGLVIPKLIGVKIDDKTIKQVGNLLEPIDLPRFDYGKHGETRKKFPGMRDVDHFMKDMITGRNEIVETLNKAGAQLVISLVFGRREQSKFSYQHTILDVPSDGFLRYYKMATIWMKSMNSLGFYGRDYREWYLDFPAIYHIFPLYLRRINNRVQVFYTPILALYDSLLTRRTYPQEAVLKQAVRFAKIVRFGQRADCTVKVPKTPWEVEEAFCKGILKYNILLSILKEINLNLEQNFKSPKEISNNSEKLEKNMSDFFAKAGYTEAQKALFKLGVIVGEIGSAQFKLNKKKSILEKINFDGMTVERVKMLSTQLLESLKNYHLLSPNNEALYAEAKLTLDKSLPELQNPLENVFYIISGYSFITLRILNLRGGEENGTTK